jgi:membrane protein DedA with SNARE-associated domain
VTIPIKEAATLSLANEPIFEWMSQYAYSPTMVYVGIIVMMLLSAVGLPLPEEVTLISVGILAYMGGNPDIFPPPYEGAPVINSYEAAFIAFVAVFCSDFLIYGIGRRWGRKLLYSKKLSGIFKPEMMEKVEKWTHKYGAYACGIFRFTPGIRFPGHLACGMLKFPAWKFGLIDGMAAAISVPTQILLIAHYGEPILKHLRKFKMTLLWVVVVVILIFIAYKLRQRWLRPTA